MYSLPLLGWGIALIRSKTTAPELYYNHHLANRLITNRFNWAIRKLYKRLLQLGARDFYPRGESDSQHPEG